MEASEGIVLGIDIGGSHITLALVNMYTQSIIEHSYYRAYLNTRAKLEPIMDIWVNAINSVFDKEPIEYRRIGMAMPGPFDYATGVSHLKDNKKYDALYGCNIKEILAQRLNIGTNQIRMFNDAACFLQGEVFAGVAKNYSKAIGITLGTGLGTAVLSNGVARDANLWNSDFKEAKAEDYISSRWFAKRYFELSGINLLDVRALNEIAAESPVARAVFKEFSENLTLFIKQFIEAEQPEVVVLGGNITKAAAWYMPAVSRALKRYGIDIPVHISDLKENAALLGAAGCWQNNGKILSV
jgi:glucokinase